MAGNTHRANCANAQRPGCQCSGCGGSLHGWQGWTLLAFAPRRARDDRRRRLASGLTRNRRGVLGGNAGNRGIGMDLARLDIADHLSAGSPHWSIEGRRLPTVELTDPAVISSDAGRMVALGQTIMAETGDQISADLDNLLGDDRARDVRRLLANHAWCGLLVTLIHWVEQVGSAARLLSAEGRDLLRRFLTGHLSGLTKDLAEAVAGVVLDRVWSALAKLLEAHFPLLGADTLRVLRMLAVFACPAVDRHAEVYRHAVRPLLADAGGVVSAEVTAQVEALFGGRWPRPVGATTA